MEVYLERPAEGAAADAPLLYTSPLGGAANGGIPAAASSGSLLGGIPAAASTGSVSSLASGGGGGNGTGQLAGTLVLAPYPRLEPLQQKRLAARRHKTTFCYDFPSVFADALRQAWAVRAAAGEPDSAPPPGHCPARCCEICKSSTI